MILIAFATLLVVGLIEGRRILEAFSRPAPSERLRTRPRREHTSPSEFHSIEQTEREAPELDEEIPPDEAEEPLEEEALVEEEPPPEEAAFRSGYIPPKYLPALIVAVSALRKLLRRSGEHVTVPPLTREQLSGVRKSVLEVAAQRGLEAERASVIADAVVARMALAGSEDSGPELAGPDSPTGPVVGEV